MLAYIVMGSDASSIHVFKILWDPVWEALENATVVVRRWEYVLAKVGGVGGIRSHADEMTQTFRTEKSLV